MSDKQLHILSFTVPYPVNYGGVFDIYNKIVALHNAGVKIHLHCFTEHNRQAPQLHDLCEHVYYYPRRKGIAGLSLHLPYIVASRIDRRLFNRLENDDHPVLIEGVHCAAWLIHKQPSARKIILRLHNVEHDYYRQLYLATSSTLKKFYYHVESKLLSNFEQRIATMPSLILAVSARDADTYKTRYNISNVSVLPVFTGFNNHRPPSGKGYFCLYHGNLSVPENEKAVAWLLNEVFHDLHIPFVIAGKNPSPALRQFIARFENAKLIPDPSQEKMERLIADAQCNVLPSFNTTGVKLKIINALFHGRHCIVNRSAVEGSGVESLCHIAKTRQDFRQYLLDLASKPFTENDIHQRMAVLNNIFNDDNNCADLIRQIW